MNDANTPIDGFAPFVVRTDNIAKELVATAAKYKLKASDLDFNLLDVQTFLSKSGAKDVVDEVGVDELEGLDDKALLCDPNTLFRQTYEIEIIKDDKKGRLSELQLSIGANPSMSRLFASIKPGSVIPYYNSLEKDLRQFIDKRKLRAHMLIGFWNGKLSEELAKFVAKVHVAGTLNVQEKINFEVGCALDPVDTIDDKLIIHYEKPSSVDELEKVDHAKRGFIQGVQKGELLIEYIKAKEGKPGRSCRGEYLAAKEPVTSHVPAFNVSDKIDVIENDDRIEYRAKENGYISFENNTYDVKVEMEVTEISFKTTGSIEAGVDTDVSLNVKESDAFKDAIGAGMEIEVNEINVDGNVGNNARIKARKVKIQGQTHQSSYIEADDVKVNIHKGKIKGGRVEISRLEQGMVEADSVEVFQATGGKIVAREVLIDTLSSHVNIVASSKIEITHLKGNENSFTISPVLYEEDKSSLAENDDAIVAQRRKIKELNEEVVKKQSVLDNNKDAIIDLKKKITQYQSNGTKIPPAFAIKYKEFQELQKNVLSVQKELQQHSDMLELLLAKSNEFQSNIMEAKIINHDAYKGHNEIRFKLLDPDLELYLVPTGGINEKCFMLQRDEDTGEYKIVGSDII